MRQILFITLCFISSLAFSQDVDKDGILDTDDNCPNISNPNQADDDGDGIGNACDICLGNNATGDYNKNGICDDRDPRPLSSYSEVDFNMFPNPASDYLFLDYPSNDKYSIKLYSILGRLVMESEQKIIDLHKIPSGIYYLSAKEDSDYKGIVNKVLLIK